MRQNLIIRPALRTDLHAIRDVQIASVRELCAGAYPAKLIETWTASLDADWIGGLMDKGRKFFVAVEHETLCGYGALDIPEHRLTALFVHPHHAHGGLGARLLRHLETEAAKFGVKSLAVHSSLNAQRFYAKHGYAANRPEKLMLPIGLEIDAIVMTKNLDAAANKNDTRPAPAAKGSNRKSDEI